MNKATKMYESINLASEILDADPHRLVQLLMEGFIARVNAAKGFIERRNYTEKSVYINKSIDILNGLMMSLDSEKGGEIAEVLDELYRYMLNELVKANMMNDPIILEKIKNIMQNIKDGWDVIPQEIRDQYSSEVVQYKNMCVEP